METNLARNSTTTPAPKSAVTVYLLYGHRVGQPEYTEQILCSQPARFDEVKALATKDGFTGFRIAKHVDGVMPNFSRTVQA